MTEIPVIVATTKLHQLFSANGLVRIHQGKVRETYDLGEGRLLVVATDRVSIFDFVLACLIEGKGEILTAMTVYWLTSYLNDMKHHMLAYGCGIDEHLPGPLRHNQELQKRALVVKQLFMYPYEFIVRAYLTGSGWREYRETGRLGETDLPEDLFDGSRLPELVFDPSTKAEVGHDQRVPISDAVSACGNWAATLPLEIFRKVSIEAERAGIILADTKFEFGWDPDDATDEPCLGDEICTPDSSRFWDKMDWIRCAGQRTSPPSFDKEVVRDWGKEVNTGIVGEDGDAIIGMHNKRIDPANPAHVANIHELCPPGDLLQLTRNRYHEVFGKLTGMNLEKFQKEKMGIGSVA